MARIIPRLQVQSLTPGQPIMWLIFTLVLVSPGLDPASSDTADLVPFWVRILGPVEYKREDSHP